MNYWAMLMDYYKAEKLLPFSSDPMCMASVILSSCFITSMLDCLELGVKNTV